MKAYLIKPGTQFRLSDFDPAGGTEMTGDKDEAILLLEALRTEIRAFQRRLYAEGRQRLLVVLQAMDGGGKDGTVRHVFNGVDPHGFRAVSFKSPTQDELARDFLWRIHHEVPSSGEIVVFNRSHYEDIVAAGVKKLVPPEIVERRFDHVVNFERLLTGEGTVVIKFFLHISRDEQRRRLQARLEDPGKHWKLNPEDLNDRKLWPRFIPAYDEVLSRTSTAFAPWFVIPANRKWYRNLIVARIVRDTLMRMNPQFPEPSWDPGRVRLEA